MQEKLSDGCKFSDIQRSSIHNPEVGKIIVLVVAETVQAVIIIAN